MSWNPPMGSLTPSRQAAKGRGTARGGAEARRRGAAAPSGSSEPSFLSPRTPRLRVPLPRYNGRTLRTQVVLSNESSQSIGSGFPLAPLRLRVRSFPD